jgi:polyketide synthase PksM
MSFLEQGILPSLNKRVAEISIPGFLEYEKIINKCCLSICYTVLKQYGLFQEKAETFTFHEFVQQRKISSHAFYVLKQMLFILEEENVISRSGDTCRVEQLLDIESPPELLVSLTRKFPHEGASFQWLARAYAGLPELMAGRLYAEDIMFPWGSLELVEDVYFSSRVYRFFPEMAGYAVAQLVKKYCNDTISLLEVGAGTGNGTSSVLHSCPHDFKQYLYTDVMRSCLKKAKKSFAGYPFIDYRLYDIDKDPVDQNLEKKSVDMILAVNTLHAAQDVTRSVNYLHSLLKEKGCLVISEIGPPRNSLYRYMELTFGLLASYYEYEDKDLRPLAPIIRPEEWAGVLKKAGFSQVIYAPSGNDGDADRGGVIIGCT